MYFVNSNSSQIRKLGKFMSFYQQVHQSSSRQLDWWICLKMFICYRFGYDIPLQNFSHSSMKVWTLKISFSFKIRRTYNNTKDNDHYIFFLYFLLCLRMVYSFKYTYTYFLNTCSIFSDCQHLRPFSTSRSGLLGNKMKIVNC